MKRLEYSTRKDLHESDLVEESSPPKEREGQNVKGYNDESLGTQQPYARVQKQATEICST